MWFDVESSVGSEARIRRAKTGVVASSAVESLAARGCAVDERVTSSPSRSSLLSHWRPLTRAWDDHERSLSELAESGEPDDAGSARASAELGIEGG